MHRRLNCRVGSSNFPLKMMRATMGKLVHVDLTNRVVKATPSATLSDVFHAIKDAEVVELASAWPPPRLTSLGE